MPDDDSVSLKDFGASFKGFMETMVAQAPPQESVFLERLRAHFGGEPRGFPIISEKFSNSDHPNLQVALNAYLEAENRKSEVLGVAGVHDYFGIELTHLVSPGASQMFGGSGPAEGPVQYVNVSLDSGRTLPCVKRGLFLIRDGDQPLVALVGGQRASGMRTEVSIEVMSAEREVAEGFLAAIRTLMRKRNVYRGRVVSLEADQFEIKVRFHRLAKVGRDDIILPEGLLERVERQTVVFGQHRDSLLAAGRHLKRGILLHGPPGTGKTLTAMYLAGRMSDRTTLLLTGRSQGLIEECGRMARLLEPSMVILEDVDLVAEERTRPNTGCAPLLFELLNQMDGLGNDADVVFVLTTNRPDILEPALAARPGRIDLACEVPLPDADCRRRLFELYGKGLDFDVEIETYVARTEHVSAAFIRELLRKAALFSADAGDEMRITPTHLDAALHELAIAGGDLTRSLLGAPLADSDATS